MFSGFSRRQLLKLTGGLVAGGSGFLLSSLLHKDRTTAQTVFVRPNIATLTPAQIAALRNGVRVMQSRPASNQTSWIYQANMHGGIGSTRCDHGTFFFLSWHRMYLYYFERILRAASGDPNLALPYWNYSDSAAQRSLPEPFRNRLLPNGSTNTLYVSQRSPSAPNINGGEPMTAEVVSYTAAFRRTNFFNTTAGGGSFGGRRVTVTNHTGDSKGALEIQPHDLVHGAVGGPAGWMNDINMAARDPIFWPHHANIDRLWESWLQLEPRDGRANPTGNRDWMNDSFTFFDENRSQVTLRGRDIINTAQQLNYRYAELSRLQVSRDEVQLGSSRDDADQALQTTVASTQLLAQTPTPEDMEPLAGTPQDRELRAAPVTVTLPGTKELSPGVFAARALQERFIILNIEGIEYDPSNSIPYQIYINQPEGVTPDPESPHYVGILALFALRQGGTFRIDITDAVRELQRRNLMTGDSIKVTLVPPPGQVTQLQRTVGIQPVRFSGVTITRE